MKEMNRKRKVQNLDGSCGSNTKISVISKEQLFSLVEDGNLRGFKKKLNYADIMNDRDELGNTYLHRVAMQCSNITQYEERKAMLKYLLTEAPDLMIVKNNEGDSVLAIASKNDLIDDLVTLLHKTGMQVSTKCLDPNLKNDIWLSLIKHKLIEIDPECKSLENVPINLLHIIFNRRFWSFFKKDVVFLYEATVDIFMQDIQFESHDELSIKSFKFLPLYYDVVSFAFKSFVMGNEYEVDGETEFVARMLMDYTENSKDTSLYDCVSPLTILMCKEVTESSKNIFRELIQRGVNVESQILQVKEIQCGLIDDQENTHHNVKEKAQYYNNIRNRLKLPDALLIAFLSKKYEFVETLLSHWWAPPIALLFFDPNLCIEDFNFWFPILIKYGGITHGRFFQQLKHRFYTLEITGDDAWIQSYLHHLAEFSEMMKSPLSLREIAKYAVRQSLAERASQSDTSLPALLEQLIDPPLHHLLKH